MVALFLLCLHLARAEPECEPDEAYCENNGNCVQDCLDCGNTTFHDIDKDLCVVRELFTDWAREEVLAVGIWLLVAGLATSAGLGGGGIFVPMGMLVLRLPSKVSTALSQASIFGACLAGLSINLCKKHPLANRPLINFDMALFLAPMEMSGAMVGVLVQKVMPDWLIIICMFIILTFVSVQTLRKGFATLKKERINIPSSPPLTPDKLETERQKTMEEETSEAPSVEDLKMKTREFWIKHDACFPWKKVSLLLLVWISLLGLMLLRGGKGAKSLISDFVPVCRTAYWGLFGFGIFFLCTIGFLNGCYVVKRGQEKRNVGVLLVKGDVAWSFAGMLGYCWCTFVAGVIAGLIGTGGGMILGPLLLYLDILPQVQSATMAMLIVLTSSVAATLSLTSGLVSFSYAGIYFGAAFAGSVIGKTIIDSLVKRHRLTSLLILILGGLILVAALMVALVGLLKYSSQGWHLESFSSPC